MERIGAAADCCWGRGACGHRLGCDVSWDGAEVEEGVELAVAVGGSGGAVVRSEGEGCEGRSWGRLEVDSVGQRSRRSGGWVERREQWESLLCEWGWAFWWR